MRRTADQIRQDKIKKIKRSLFSLVIRDDRVERMTFETILTNIINSFNLGRVSKEDYNFLYRYFYKLKKNRKKLVEERRISEEVITLLYKKLQNDEITYDYAKEMLNLLKPYFTNAEYREWNKIFSALRRHDKD